MPSTTSSSVSSDLASSTVITPSLPTFFIGDQVAVFAGLRVEAVGILILFKDLTDDHRAVFASIDRDLTGRIGQRLAHDIDAGLLVVVLVAKPLEVRGGTEQGDAAARHAAFRTRAPACI